jgi:hypothetical protein
MDRTDLWASQINDAFLSGGSDVAGGIFNAMWNAMGPFGDFMRAFVQDVMTACVLVIACYGPYLLYMRYKEFQLQQLMSDPESEKLEPGDSIEGEQEEEEQPINYNVQQSDTASRSKYKTKRYPYNIRRGRY